MNDILKHRQSVQANIQRLFGEGIDCNADFQKAQDAEIEKARHGTYADTAENRKKNRVGQEYGHKAQEKEANGKQPKQSEEAGGKDYSTHAQNASDNALKRAAADEKADKGVRDAAKKELEKRGKSGGGDDGGNKKSSSYKTASPKEKKRFDDIIKECYKYEGKGGLFDELVWEIDPEDGDIEQFVDLDADDADEQIDNLIREKISPERLEQIYKKWRTGMGIKDVGEEKREKSRLGKRDEKDKDDWMKRIQEFGYGREDEDLMIRNQKYFQDVLDKHGIKDVGEFFDEDKMQDDKDFEDYEKIFDECFEKIPAKEFKR